MSLAVSAVGVSSEGRVPSASAAMALSASAWAELCADAARAALPRALARATRQGNNATNRCKFDVNSISCRILYYLGWQEIVKLTRDLQPGTNAYRDIDDVLKYAQVLKAVPRLRVIDEASWVRGFTQEALSANHLTFEGAPSLADLCCLRHMRSLDEMMNLKMENPAAGCTLFLMPGHLSFNTFRAMAEALPEGQAGRIVPICDQFVTELGAAELEAASTDRPYWVVTTNTLLRESRDLSVEKQRALVERQGGQMPCVLDAVALCFLTYIGSSGPDRERLLSDAPCWSFTRCEDRVDGSNLVVGGFAPNGLFVKDCGRACMFLGVLALRRFFQGIGT